MDRSDVGKPVFVRGVESQMTGGGLECDVIELQDGTVLVISDDAIVLYPDMLSWEQNPRAQLGTIPRMLELSLKDYDAFVQRLLTN